LYNITELNREDRLIARIKAHISNDGDINEPDLLEESIIVRSLNDNMFKLAEFLIQNGASLTYLDSEGDPALQSVFFHATQPLLEAVVNSNKETPLPQEVVSDAFIYLCQNVINRRNSSSLRMLIYILDSFSLDVNSLLVENKPLSLRIIEEENYDVLAVLAAYGMNLDIESDTGISLSDIIDSRISTCREYHRKNLEKIKWLLHNVSLLRETGNASLDLRNTTSFYIIKPYTSELADGVIVQEGGATNTFIPFEEGKEINSTGFMMPAILDENRKPKLVQEDGYVGVSLFNNTKKVISKAELEGFITFK
jgi:hypothetical protein